MERGALYIRVSTEEQTEYSPAAQKKALLDYAKRNNILISEEHIFSDEGITGRKAEKRPDFMRMIAMAKEKPKPFDIILVHRFDRFARNREDSVVYKSLLRKDCGIKVVSITEQLEDDKFSIILESMLEAMAEYYSLNLSDEVKKGMREKASNGFYQGIPPYGYDVENGILIPNDEAAIVKFIFDKYVNENKSYFGIAKELNNKNIKTRTGKPFYSTLVKKIVTNPAYHGKVRWGLYKSTNEDDIILVDGKHSPLVTTDIWNKAQTRYISKNTEYKKYAKPPERLNHWLSGLIRCSNCGSTLSVGTNRRKLKSGKIKIVKHFQCNLYLKGPCRVSHSINLDKAEKIILAQIKSDSANLSGVKITIKTPDSEIDILKNQLKKFENRKKRINNAYEAGVDTLEEYKNKKQKITEEEKLLVTKIKAMEIPSVDEDKFRKTLKANYDLLNDPSVDKEIKVNIARSFIKTIIFHKESGILFIEYQM